MKPYANGGTPCRARAAAQRQRLFRLVQTCGTIRRDRISDYFPAISKHAMDKHIQHLRGAGLIEKQSHGVWRCAKTEGN